MAYVRCGNYDCEYHNKRRGCALKRVGISRHDKEEIREEKRELHWIIQHIVYPINRYHLSADRRKEIRWKD